MTKKLLIYAIVSITMVFSQNQDLENKVDSVLLLQKKIYKIAKNDPLADKNYGIELNLVRLLVAEEDEFSVTGGFSMFNVDRSAEIVFPVYYGKDNTSKVFSVDAHYRKFLGESQNGFYFSALARYTYINAVLGKDFQLFPNNGKDEWDTESKFGIGFGIGFRLFTERGFYWGASLSLGRYLTGKNNRFKNLIIDDSKIFIDIELLKFGYAF